VSFVVAAVLAGALIALNAGHSVNLASGRPLAASDAVSAVMIVWVMATLVPTLALSVRRYHDAGLSGWAMLVALVPAVGWVFFILLAVRPADPDGRRYD
jgi:uncharacterized membrane protein YhaH (DUF805 family)